ncbi:MAG: hypothetical protein ABW032_10630 [Burkholderiaceae bacterium]
MIEVNRNLPLGGAEDLGGAKSTPTSKLRQSAKPSQFNGGNATIQGLKTLSASVIPNSSSGLGRVRVKLPGAVENEVDPRGAHMRRPLASSRNSYFGDKTENRNALTGSIATPGSAVLIIDASNSDR